MQKQDIKTIGVERYNRDLMFTTIRRGVGLGLLICSVGLLVWASLPSRVQMMEQVILPAEMKLPNDEQPAKAVLETRQVRLEWPESMRIGDSAEIRLIFESVGEEKQDANSDIELSNVYNQYNLMVEGRFEVSGLKVNPANPLRESLLAGEIISYDWNVTAENAGIYPGTVWLSLRFLPLEGDVPSQAPIFVTKVDIKATSLWGISGPIARLLGGLGVALGIIMLFDVMIGLLHRLIKT